MNKKIIRLKESDLENIVKRVLIESEHNEQMGDEMETEVDMDVETDEESLDITLDQIAMLLKDGECSCSGQKLVLNLEGGHEEEDDDDEEDED